MTNHNPNIFFRQAEYDELYRIYVDKYNGWIHEATNYFSRIKDWDSFNLMVLGGKYHTSFSSLLDSYQNVSFKIYPINSDCNAFTFPIDEVYNFSIFQSQPFFYLSIFLTITFLISFFQKRNIVKYILGILFMGGIAGNLINYYLVEPNIIKSVENSINSENCKESIYIKQFQDKYIELLKIEPYRLYGQYDGL